MEKQKKFQNFRRRASLHINMFKSILHAKAKAWVVLTTSPTFAVILSAVSLPIVPKVEFNFEIMLYITIFLFSKVRETALNPRSISKNYLKAFNRSSWFENSVLVDLPFWGHLNIDLYIFPFYYKSQSSNFSMLGMKTRPLTFADLARKAPLLLPTSSRRPKR